MKDDECQIEVESKASGAASDTGSHSPASSHYSTHSSGASVIAHSRSTANTPLRDRHGRNSDSGKHCTCIYVHVEADIFLLLCFNHSLIDHASYVLVNISACETNSNAELHTV